jgi:hypothetical protein
MRRGRPPGLLAVVAAVRIGAAVEMVAFDRLSPFRKTSTPMLAHDGKLIYFLQETPSW